MITADVLNQEYQITTVPSSNTYTFNARTANTPINTYYSNGVVDDTSARIAANSSDTNTGGSSTVGAYQANRCKYLCFGNGWGAGAWSRASWSQKAQLTVLSEIMRLWTHDTFGEDLIFNVKDGPVFYWDTSASTGNRAIYLTALTGASNAPCSKTGYGI